MLTRYLPSVRRNLTLTLARAGLSMKDEFLSEKLYHSECLCNQPLSVAYRPQGRINMDPAWSIRDHMGDIKIEMWCHVVQVRIAESERLKRRG